MEINIDELIEIIIREVITELSKRGVEVDFSNITGKTYKAFNSSNNATNSIVINMKGYKTSVLTESHLEHIESNVTEIVVPKGTVLTPGARDLIKKKNLIINNN